MRILAIDPGPTESAYVVYDGVRPIEFAKIGNDEMLLRLGWASNIGDMTLVIEQVAAMGMSVGAEVFETVFWTGRFAQEVQCDWDRVKRMEVKMHLCHDSRAKDGNIRQALIDKYGGKERAIGKKKTPGPLFGISGDCWQALALAVCYSETRRKAESA